MVSVEQKSNYLQQFEKDNNISFLKDYVWHNRVDEFVENSSNSHKLIFALAKSDKTVILDLVEDFSAKNPTSDSQYIYRDLDIFLFICVTKKFELPQDWLLNFIDKRISSEEESKRISKSFENLLNNNLESKDNYEEIILVYKSILEINTYNELELNETYEKLSKTQFPFYNSNFLNVLSLKAIDIIVTLKGLTDFDKHRKLNLFSDTFNHRIKQISIFIFIIIILALLGVSGYVTFKLFLGSNEESQFADKILTAFGAISFLSVWGLIWKSNEVIQHIKKILARFFGYNIDKALKQLPQ